MRLIPILLVFLLAGCGALGRANQVRFADDVSDEVVAEMPTLARTGDDLLRVSVPLRNVSGEDLQLLVQIEFLDGAGRRYNDETPRQVFLLARGQTKDFIASSMLAKADDFVAHVWRNQ